MQLHTKPTSSIFLHAPNVHVGGGLQLLKGLLLDCASSFDWMQLDQRIQGIDPFSGQSNARWVKRSIWARIYAEWVLFRSVGPGETVLCFHGLPPVFRLQGRVVVFVQNRILFESSTLSSYPFITRLRLFIERKWTKFFSSHCNRYIVQSPSMAAVVRRCLGEYVEISVMPYLYEAPNEARVAQSSSYGKYDFIYVASGEPHKNHRNLLLAWLILAKAQLKPSLALTVDPVIFPELASEIYEITHKHALYIDNLKKLNSDEITKLYRASSALIFPSMVESFGLPLIEATLMGLPVLASELDYVRDVIEPVETFDPESPVSIARAVRRFIKNPDPIITIGTAEEFMAELLR